MSERGYMSIGDVLTLLQGEFPDVTISKIRFLESQGLVDPERTPSGYRKFYDHDVERLRWVLRQQREHFLPLKVIKGRLEQSPEREPDNGRDRAGGPPEADLREGHLGDRDRLLAERHAGDWGAPAAVPAAGPAPVLVGRQPEGRGGHPSQQDPHAPWHGRQRPGAAAPAPRRSERGTPRPGLDRGNGAEGMARALSASRSAPAVVAPRGRTGGESSAGEPAGTLPGPGPDEPDEAEVTRGSERQLVTGPHDGGHLLGERHPSGLSRAGPGEPAGRAVAALGEAGMTLDELAQASGLTGDEVGELESYGLVVGRTLGGVTYYDEEAVEVARLAAGFAQHGVEARHLRLHLLAAQREAGFIEQIVMPYLKQRNPASRQRAQEIVSELTRQGQELRAVLLHRILRELLGG